MIMLDSVLQWLHETLARLKRFFPCFSFSLRLLVLSSYITVSKIISVFWIIRLSRMNTSETSISLGCKIEWIWLISCVSQFFRRSDDTTLNFGLSLFLEIIFISIHNPSGVMNSIFESDLKFNLLALRVTFWWFFMHESSKMLMRSFGI